MEVETCEDYGKPEVQCTRCGWARG